MFDGEGAPFTIPVTISPQEPIYFFSGRFVLKLQICPTFIEDNDITSINKHNAYHSQVC